MVKVGTVYKSDGNVDLSTLPTRIKLNIFLHHMIDSSYILSGNRDKMTSLKEEEEKKKVVNYTKALMYYLERSVFKSQPVIPMTYDIEDSEFVKIATGNPIFFPYSKEFVPMEPNLIELGAYKSGVLIIRRLML